MIILNKRSFLGLTAARERQWREFWDEKVKIMLSTLEKGCSIGHHIHKTSSEITYVIEGEAKCVLDGKEEIVRAGQCHYCPKGACHSLRNDSEEILVMFDVVSER